LKYITLILAFVSCTLSYGQDDNIDYQAQRTYRIGNIEVQGNNTVDKNAIKLISELNRDQKITIPGQEITNAIKKLWKQNLFSDIQIYQAKVTGEFVNLVIQVQELPRLSHAVFTGDVTKGDNEKLRELTNVYPGRLVNENLKIITNTLIKNYYKDKGYLNVKVTSKQELDETKNNAVKLFLDVKKGNKFKINDIIIHGNKSVAENKLYRSMKETKRKRWWRVFKRSKYLKSTYEEDQLAFIRRFNDIGLRDAIITSDTIYQFDDKTINIEMHVDEGSKYYFGDFDWVGNTKYRSGFLDTVLAIQSGDIYNQSLLDSRLCC